jgi:hypothetical protein
MNGRGRVAILALLLAAFAAFAAAPRPAAAQARVPTAQELETARTLYKEGKELRAKGDLRGALEKFQAAHALGNTPVTGIELARTYAQLGQIVEARETCLYIARIAVAGDETGKSAEARIDAAKLADELRPRIPTLIVRVSGLAPGESASLLVDGVAVPEAALGEPLKVDPGAHEVVARAGEGPAARSSWAAAEVKDGETRELVISLPASPSPSASTAGAPRDEGAGAAPARHGMSGLMKVGLVTGIGGLVVGTFSGVAAIIQKNKLDNECPNLHCTDANNGYDDLQSARTLSTVANLSFVVAGAGGIAVVIALLQGDGEPPAPNSASISPWVGLGAAGVHGSF